MFLFSCKDNKKNHTITLFNIFSTKIEECLGRITYLGLEQGLETPLQQKRLIEAWPEIAGPFFLFVLLIN